MNLEINDTRPEEDFLLDVFNFDFDKNSLQTPCLQIELIDFKTEELNQLYDKLTYIRSLVNQARKRRKSK